MLAVDMTLGVGGIAGLVAGLDTPAAAKAALTLLLGVKFEEGAGVALVLNVFCRVGVLGSVFSRMTVSSIELGAFIPLSAESFW